MERKVVGKAYTFRQRRCHFCDRRVGTTQILVDIYVPSQTDLGADVLEHVDVAHKVCVVGVEIPGE